MLGLVLTFVVATFADNTVDTCSATNGYISLMQSMFDLDNTVNISEVPLVLTFVNSSLKNMRTSPYPSNVTNALNLIYTLLYAYDQNVTLLDQRDLNNQFNFTASVVADYPTDEDCKVANAILYAYMNGRYVCNVMKRSPGRVYEHSQEVNDLRQAIVLELLNYASVAMTGMVYNNQTKDVKGYCCLKPTEGHYLCPNNCTGHPKVGVKIPHQITTDVQLETLETCLDSESSCSFCTWQLNKMYDALCNSSELKKGLNAVNVKLASDETAPTGDLSDVNAVLLEVLFSVKAICYTKSCMICPPLESGRQRVSNSACDVVPLCENATLYNSTDVCTCLQNIVSNATHFVCTSTNVTSNCTHILGPSGECWCTHEFVENCTCPPGTHLCLHECVPKSQRCSPLVYIIQDSIKMFVILVSGVYLSTKAFYAALHAAFNKLHRLLRRRAQRRKARAE